MCHGSLTNARYRPNVPFDDLAKVGMTMESRQDLSRRGFMVGMAGVAGTLLAAGAAAPALGAEHKNGSTVTAKQAMRWLKEGNRRWASGNLKQVDHTPPNSDITKGQWPFASLLSCADSRVNVERVFDVQQGNLFNVRNAGNIGSDDISIGSLEYSVAVLKVPLLVVLGHGSCGAVSASQNALRTGEMPGGDIDAVVDAILPAIEGLPNDQTLAEGTWANAAYSSRALKQSSILRNAIDNGKLRVTYAVYDLATRRVKFA